MRLCTLILSSAYFEGDLTFSPDYEHIDERREENEISFQDERMRLEVAGRRYKEWMVKCIPAQRYASFQAEYFVSRVRDSDDQAFVYRWGKNSEIVIENVFENVRFEI